MLLWASAGIEFDDARDASCVYSKVILLVRVTAHARHHACLLAKVFLKSGARQVQLSISESQPFRCGLLGGLLEVIVEAGRNSL